MGILVEELSNVAGDLITAVSNMKKYTRKLADIEDMAMEEIIQVCYDSWCSSFEWIRYVLYIPDGLG